MGPSGEGGVRGTVPQIHIAPGSVSDWAAQHTLPSVQSDWCSVDASLAPHVSIHVRSAVCLQSVSTWDGATVCVTVRVCAALRFLADTDLIMT
jgi:hypothetical protein